MLDEQRFGLPVSQIAIDTNHVKVSPDLAGMPDADDADIAGKIKDARGQTVHFSLTADAAEVSGKKYHKNKLGKLIGFAGSQIRIERDEDFRGSVREQIKSGEFYTKTSRGIPSEADKREGASFIRLGAFVEHIGKNMEALSEEEGAQTDKAAAAESKTSLPFEFAKTDGQQQTNFYYGESENSVAFSCDAVKEKLGWKIDPDSIAPKRLMIFADFIGDLYQIGVMHRGLQSIKKKSIWQVLSGERVSHLPEEVDIEWDGDCRLNGNQKQAVQAAVGAKELCLIWGPPGTGKTEVIMEIARQNAMRGKKTLISSQANLAVDNALTRLHGAPDAWTLRVAKKNYTLEDSDKSLVPMENTAHKFFAEWLHSRLNNSASEMEGAEVAKLRKRLASRLQKMGKSQNRPAREKEQLAKIYRRRINIVGATLMETGKTVFVDDARKNTICENLAIKEFDAVIVDEVSKATPPELFLPALLGKRLILVGDHKQLPPMLKLISSGDDLSQEEWAREAGVPEEELDIDSSLFERLWERHGGEASPVRTMLTTQYRMHPDIQNLIEGFYEDNDRKLECGLSPEDQAGLALAAEGMFSKHAVWVDTVNDAIETKAGTSYTNNDEIRIVGKLLDALPKTFPNGEPLSVGVITFYGAQLQRLRTYETQFAHKFPGKLIFGTVDRFQGRECDVVICSLVRKNKYGSIGFASKVNRINVAFSRARALLCIVGNSGQFCYEAKAFRGNEKEVASAKRAYKDIWKKCDQTGERNIPSMAEADIYEVGKKWGANVRKG